MGQAEAAAAEGGAAAEEGVAAAEGVGKEAAEEKEAAATAAGLVVVETLRRRCGGTWRSANGPL